MGFYMYCGNCGRKLNENDHFCGICGRVVTKIEYIEEKPMESLYDNRTVILLTFCFLVLSIATIVCASIITKDIPEVDQLNIIHSILF